MKSSQNLFIAVVFIGFLASCPPEHINEYQQAEDPSTESIEEINPSQNMTPDTGDDQSIEPDNDKDG